MPKGGIPLRSAAENPSEGLHGLPQADTPSSSDKEPAPQSTQESSQVSLCHSQHPKKKSSREGSHSKAHKKSKCHKEEMPKKEKWDKADKHKSKKSHKK